MKYFLILLSLSACLSYAEDNRNRSWVLGKYSIDLKQPCGIHVKVADSTMDISDLFGKNTTCNIAYLSQTNIPNVFVIGGGYVLIVERKILGDKTCKRISKALYLPNIGEAVLSNKEIKSGNCDGHIEVNSAMYMVSPIIKYNKPLKQDK